MGWRRLGDGSFMNTDTGEVRGLDPQREAAARNISEQAGHVRPRVQPAVPNKGQQITPVVAFVPPRAEAKTIIQPRAQELAVDPYGTGMGILPAMSDNAKRIMLTGLIVAGAFGAVWIGSKMKGKPSAKSKK